MRTVMTIIGALVNPVLTGVCVAATVLCIGAGVPMGAVATGAAGLVFGYFSWVDIRSVLRK